jgi:hypothetical protein
MSQYNMHRMLPSRSQVVRGLLTVEPSLRTTAVKLLRDPWVTGHEAAVSARDC